MGAISRPQTSSWLDQVIQNRIVTHLIFWSSYLLAFSLISSLNTGTFVQHLLGYLALIPAQMMAAYLMVYYQVPKLLLKRKYVFFCLSFFLTVYVFSVLARLCVIYIVEPLTRSNFEQEPIIEIFSDPAYILGTYFPVVYVIGFIMLVLKTYKERFDEKHQLEVLQKEKATNELKFLKAQIHPHFLFNTLNSLYALTMAKSDIAPQVVVKLSEILDYILYQCNEPRVHIQKELELLQGYIELEMLRYGDVLELSFNHEIDNPQTEIAPLIMLSIIENAFKHGASKNPINPCIHIDLKLVDEQLELVVFNTKSVVSSPEQQPDKREGIGAGNVKRQLVLNYPNHHEIHIEEDVNSYQVQLSIRLN